MIRKGRFALLNGKEYELISYQGHYYLKSNDPIDINNGFIKMNNNEQLFTKEVTLEDLDDVYEVFPYAMVQDYRFAVEGYNKKNETVCLVTNNPFVKDKIAVQPHGQHEYIIEIPYSEIDIKEDRISILGFENSFYEPI